MTVARGGALVVLGVVLASLSGARHASANEPTARRAQPRAVAARRAIGSRRAPRSAVLAPHRAWARWPGLAAPSLRGEAKHGWAPASAQQLRFDAQGAWWALASLLEVLPVLPRLDGTVRTSIAGEAVLRVASASVVAAKSGGGLILGGASSGLPSAGAWFPGAALRVAGARLLRSLGLGSIAGQAVFVLEGTVDADETDDAAVLEALPSRSWQAPSYGDEDLDAGPGPMRTTRGRGAMGVTTRVTLRSAALRLVGTF
jgi:hypothetical protein